MKKENGNIYYYCATIGSASMQYNVIVTSFGISFNNKQDYVQGGFQVDLFRVVSRTSKGVCYLKGCDRVLLCFCNSIIVDILAFSKRDFKAFVRNTTSC